jgi:hypothetical protein
LIATRFIHPLTAATPGAMASNASAASPVSEASRGNSDGSTGHHDNNNGRILSAKYLERNKGKVRNAVVRCAIEVVCVSAVIYFVEVCRYYQ